MGGGGGKGGGGTTTTQYPQEMRNIMNVLTPMMYNASSRAQMGMPLYNVPEAPQLPEAPMMTKEQMYNPAPSSWYTSGLDKGYNVPTYNIADTTNLAPTKDWWSNLSSGVKEGIMQPINEGGDALAERLNKYGQLGSARGGVSGTASEGLSNYYAKATPQAELAGWQMMQPGALAAFQAQNQANRDVWGGQLGSNIAGYNAKSQGVFGDWQNENQMRNMLNQQAYNKYNMDYANRVNQLNQQWGYQNQAMAAPWTTSMGLMGTGAQIPSIANYNPSTMSQIMGGASSIGNLGMGMYGMNSMFPKWERVSEI